MLFILIYYNSERQLNASTFPHWKLHYIPENKVKLKQLFFVKTSSAEQFCLSLFGSIYKIFQIPRFGLQRLNMCVGACNRSSF